MDQRPRIAADIVEVILDDLGWEEGQRAGVRARWRRLAEEQFVSRRVEFPKGADYGSHHPDVVAAFLAKHPALGGQVDLIRRRAEELGGVVTRTEVTGTDGCGVCWDNQVLVVTVRPASTLPDDDARGEWRNSFHDWWAAQDRDPVAHMLILHATSISVQEEGASA